MIVSVFGKIYLQFKEYIGIGTKGRGERHRRMCFIKPRPADLLGWAITASMKSGHVP